MAAGGNSGRLGGEQQFRIVRSDQVGESPADIGHHQRVHSVVEETVHLDDLSINGGIGLDGGSQVHGAEC